MLYDSAMLAITCRTTMLYLMPCLSSNLADAAMLMQCTECRATVTCHTPIVMLGTIRTCVLQGCVQREADSRGDAGSTGRSCGRSCQHPAEGRGHAHHQGRHLAQAVPGRVPQDSGELHHPLQEWILSTTSSSTASSRASCFRPVTPWVSSPGCLSCFTFTTACAVVPCHFCSRGVATL